jgi:hypothetical protein
MAPGDVVHDAESTVRHALWLKLARCLWVLGQSGEGDDVVGSHNPLGLGPWFSAGWVGLAYLAQNPDRRRRDWLKV